MMISGASFASIWLVLVKVKSTPGECLGPIALVAQAIDTQEIVELGVPRLLGVRHPPYPTGPKALLVTINATDVAACHLALGWRMPERIVDLLLEFRNLSNGHASRGMGGFAGGLLWFGRRTTGALTGGCSPEQMRRQLSALSELFDAMRSTLDVGRAMLRGRYLCCAARIEATGVPVDRDAVARLARNWPALKGRIVEGVDLGFGVYRGQKLDATALARWLEARGIDWPRTGSGQLDLSDDVFREMARLQPQLRVLKDLRSTLIGFTPSALAIGRDGRNRTPLRPFASKTGRNQPSAKASVFGTASWVRHLIMPPSGSGLALIDWDQQEFGIAAALSGDRQMHHIYNKGDPYIELAIVAGAAPADATATSHPRIRELYKACALGIQFGIGAERLARQLALREIDARELLRHHRAAFPQFWSWSDSIEASAALHGELRSVFGWRISAKGDSNPRSLRNFPMQANGAEMLRLACCCATESGIKVCTPNHDAILIEAPMRDLDDAIATTRRLMAEASAVVLDGFALRTSVRTVRAPDRWSEAKGQPVWSAVKTALSEVERPVRQRDRTCSPTDPRAILLSVYKRGI